MTSSDIERLALNTFRPSYVQCVLKGIHRHGMYLAGRQRRLCHTCVSQCAEESNRFHRAQEAELKVCSQDVITPSAALVLLRHLAQLFDFSIFPRAPVDARSTLFYHYGFISVANVTAFMTSSNSSLLVAAKLICNLSHSKLIPSNNNRLLGVSIRPCCVAECSNGSSWF